MLPHILSICIYYGLLVHVGTGQHQTAAAGGGAGSGGGGGISLEESGPRFAEDLPPLYAYSNVNGGKLVCRAVGQPRPQVQWLSAVDLSPVDNITSVREVDGLGNLMLKPFEWQSYRAGIHGGSYRCRAWNGMGVIISGEIQTRPVLDLPFQIETTDVVVLRGNIAVLRCSVPQELKDYVTVTSWVQDATINIYPGLPTGKYLLLPTGELYVFHVDASDAYKTFACRASSRLNNEVKTSRNNARLIVRGTEKVEGLQPTVEKEVRVGANAGEDVYLPCAAQGNPPPLYSWLREEDGILNAFSHAKSRTRGGGGGGRNGGGGGGAAVGSNGGGGLGSSHIGPILLSQVRPEDSGVYVCRVNNSISHVDLRVNLQVYAPLRVHLSPGSQVVDVGRSASFRCLVSGSPVDTISWFKDASPISPNSNNNNNGASRDTLTVAQVQAEDAGMYQCFAANDLYSAQDSAQLRLGSVLPELTYRFTEQTLQPGPPVSLKCTAVGNPPPQFTWTLDGFPIPENERFLVGQYVTIHDSVISHVNITSVEAEDGGRYSCQASNSMGTVAHAARLNIYGPPFIRLIPPVKATSGKTLQISCPVSGYPIDSISWERGGSSLPVSRQQRVFPNGTLVIENIQRGTDEGIYTCSTRNRAGLSSSRDLHIQVVVPPKIMPFQFLNEYLLEGRRLAVSCQILEGDKPIEFTWLYQGTPIASALGTSVRIPDEYSSTLVIDSLASSHNGEYTCVAENPAGKELHTAVLTVNVPPKWVLEPRDVSVAAGQLVTLQCQAEGQPRPTITWKRASSNQPGEYKELSGGSTHILRNGTIRFEEIRMWDEGQYLCEAGNGIGSGLSKVVSVRVNAPAELMDRDEEISVKAGDRGILQCRARGDLPIEIQWAYKQVRITTTTTSTHPTSNRYSIRHHELGETTLSELIIGGVGRADGGVYGCRASNAYGSDQTTVILKVQEPPEQPGNLRLIEEQSRSIQISWSEGFNGNSPLINFIIQYKFPSETWTEAEVEELAVPATQTTAILPGLSPSTTYHLRVLAQNGMGFSRPSDIIQVTTAEEAPEGSPTDVHIRPVTSTRLRVQWAPPEKHLWHGNILGYYLGYREIALALSTTAHPLPSSSNGGGNGNGGVSPSSGYGIGPDSAGYPSSSSAASASSSSSSSSLPVSNSLDTHGYHFKTVEVGPSFGGMATLENLKKYATYAVVVQAFNSKGTGPLSNPVLGTTEQDVPSAPPEKVTCVATSSSSLQVTLEDPPLPARNGIIQGYKVMHQVSEQAGLPAEMTTTTSTTTTTTTNNEVVPSRLYSVLEADEEFPVETKLTTSKSTTLHGLRTFTNYTISALAFTTVGDGVLSPPILCHTEEDVPTAPAELKAVVSSRRSILVSWLPPLRPNGRLVKFTLYIRSVDSSKIEKRVMEGSDGSYEVIDLREGQEYELWMTASTRVGEGSPTARFHISPSTKVPARIASFSQSIQVPWKRDVLLRCDPVGIPEPTTVWRFNGKDYVDSSFTNAEQAKMGSRIDVVKLGQISPDQAGNYTCTVTNPHGSDGIWYWVRVLVPPHPPNLHLLEAFHDSLRLAWTVADNGGSRIRGYVINYRREAGDWEEYKLGAGASNHLLSGLVCGSKYQVFMTAFNRIGTGQPSEIRQGRTKGETPRKEEVLTANSTSISIRLDGWRDGNCPVFRFLIQYKPGGENKWRLAASDLPGDAGLYTLQTLEPSTRYEVQVQATNFAGTSFGNYSIVTAGHHPDIFEGRLEDADPMNDPGSAGGGGNQLSLSLLIVLPPVISILAISAVIGVLCYFRHRRGLGAGRKSVIGEPPVGLQVIMDGQNRDGGEQRYCMVKNVDPSVTYQDPVRYKTLDSNYVDDICPYATFQLPDKTPGRPLLTKGGTHAGPLPPPGMMEGGNPGGNPSGLMSGGGGGGKRFGRSTGDTMYSVGNVYSGPYHSVQSSGLFYNQATLPLRDPPEYGRGGCRMRAGAKDLEGAESDNVGSTDSEVKKILTLHLPISEYDTLGSDSEGEKRGENSSPSLHHHSHQHRLAAAAAAAGKQSTNLSQQHRPPLPHQQSGGLTQEMVTFHQRQRSDPVITSDHSSGSSDSSRGSGTRKKPYFSRKSKSKSSVQSGSSSMKQRVRSSSGYSSHTEETSFSFCDRLQPPTRFSDSRDLSDGDVDDDDEELMILEQQQQHQHQHHHHIPTAMPTNTNNTTTDPRIPVNLGSIKRSQKGRQSLTGRSSASQQQQSQHQQRKNPTYHIDV